MTTTVYTIVRRSGRTEVSFDKSYFTILDNVFSEFCGAGGNWDHPNMLLKDGEIVIAEGLHHIAWNYGTQKRDALDRVIREVKAKFLPEWIPE